MKKIYTTDVYSTSAKFQLGAAYPSDAMIPGTRTFLSILIPFVLTTGYAAANTVIDAGTAQNITIGNTNYQNDTTSQGPQNVLDERLTTKTIVNSGESMVVSSGENATSTTINSGGIQNISSGGNATSTTINGGSQSGIQNISSGGNATSTTINNGGIQNVSSGGSAATTTINIGGWQIVDSGGNATSTILDRGQQRLHGESLSTTINNSGQQYVMMGGSATSTTIVNQGKQYIRSGGSATDTVIERSGTQVVSSGGIAISTIISGVSAIQTVSAGGSATSTTINSAGAQSVIGGGVTNTIINSGGTQTVFTGGVATSTTINNGGFQNISSLASATSTTVNSAGIQNVHDGGSATSTTVNSAGIQNVASGGSAIFTTVNSTGTQSIDGSATSTTVNNGGSQHVFSGGVAHATAIRSGGTQVVRRGGNASTTVIAGGEQFISSGGQAFDTTINEAGGQYISSGGIANATTISSGGFQVISKGGNAAITVINAGEQHIFDGGYASDTTVNNNGYQYVYRGAEVSATTLNNSGFLVVNEGGTAVEVTQHEGGALITNTSANVKGINPLGVFNIDATTQTANNVLLENRGILYVLTDGRAFDTTVNHLGELNIASGGIIAGRTQINDGGKLTGFTFNNNGVLAFNPINSDMAWMGDLSGPGVIEKQGSGRLTLEGTLSQSQMLINEGSVMMQNLQATTDIVAQTGTNLQLNNSILTGTIDPLDVTISVDSIWNNTGDSVLDSLSHAGFIDFTEPSGPYIPHTLTLRDLNGLDGTITLNTVLHDSSSQTDKLIIRGGRATGTTYLSVRNQGGLGAITSGDGINIVEARDGASTGNAFTQKGRIQGGAYDYTLRKGKANESWYLTTDLPESYEPETSKPDYRPETSKPNYRPEMPLYTSIFAQVMDYDAAVAGTLDDRLYHSRIKNSPAAWGRIQAGKIRHTNGGNLPEGNTPDSNTNYGFLQLGGDLAQFSTPSVTWTTGIYAASGLSHGTVTTQNNQVAGDVRDTVYTTGLYLTGRHEKGFWTDFVLQGSHHSVRAKSDDSQLKTRGPGYLASVEMGLAFSMGEELTLEPQLQYTFRGMSLDNGNDGVADVVFGQGHSHQARAGLRFGNKSSMMNDSTDVPATGDVPVTWWIRPSVTQTFGTTTTLRVGAPGVADSGVSFRPGQDGSAITLDTGVDGQIRKNATLGLRAGYTLPVQGGAADGYLGQINLKIGF